MGMFDNIKCEYPLPEAEAQDLHFQTKDFDCQMENYTITKEGRLVHHYRELEATPDDELPYKDHPKSWRRIIGSMRTRKGSERDIDMNFHGWIRFYDYIKKKDLKPELFDDAEEVDACVWYEYKAKFTDGQLVEIQRVIRE